MLSFMKVQAAPVNENQAVKTAIAFMQRQFGSRMDGNGTYQVRRAKKNHPNNQATSEGYYVFNNEAVGGGYVIVSGDDRLPEILGYSDHGSIDMDNMPPNMRAWLSQYEHIISQMDSNPSLNVPNGFHAQHSAVQAKHNIAPLITTKWGQEAPYNDMAPEINGQRAVTGCVATAMAQVMCYHRWPEAATTVIPQYGYGEELPPTTFDWDDMLDYYTGSEEAEQKAAVAELMRYAGQAAKMQYGVDGSGATAYNTIRALMECFGYSRQMQYVMHRDYTAEEWDGLIYRELREKRPVLYTGYSPWDGGHAFVCDGYDAQNDFYHFNWGWDGESDGYYLLERPLTMAGMVSFGKEHHVITGIRKPVEGEQMEETVRLRTHDLVLDHEDQTYTRTDISEDFKKIRITISQSDELIGNYQIDMGIGVYDGEELLQVAETGNFLGKDINKDVIGTLSTAIHFGAGLGDGVYQLRPMSRLHGTEEWLVDKEGDAHYIEATISGNELSACNVVHGAKLKISSLRFLGMVDDEYSYLVDITNGGPQFSGTLWMLGYFDDEERAYIFSDYPVTIGAGEHKQVEVLTTSPADWYDRYQVSIDSKGNHVIYENNAVEDQEEMLTAAATIENAIGNRFVGGVMRMHAQITNNGTEVFDRYVSAQIWEQSTFGYSNINERKRILPGETIDCYFTFFLEDGMFEKQKGMNFCMDLSCGGKRRQKTLVRTPYYTLSPGVLYWKEDGTIVADTLTEQLSVPEGAVTVDLHFAENNLFDIHPGNNPNCLYVFNGSATVPASLAGRNIIKDHHSENITLTDGAAFYSPVDFTADHISYTRHFTDTSWSTLTVPFDVSEELLEGLYVKEFRQEENDEVYFDDAERIYANEPYLVSSTLPTVTLAANDINLISNSPCSIRGNRHSFKAYMFPYEDGMKPYLLNQSGTAFVKSADEKAAPFRGFFCQNQPWEDDPEELIVHINGRMPAEAVGIENLSTDASPADEEFRLNGAIYDLQGRRVKNPKAGIYIISGSQGDKKSGKVVVVK